MSSAGAFPLLPGSSDSALVVTLQAGAYTAQVSGAGGTTGLAPLEIYEGGATPGSGRASGPLLIRAAGPALAAMGVQGALADPAMSVAVSSGAMIASNDNWGTPVGNG